MMPETAELWQARAAAWELMSLSFAYPAAELAEAAASGEWADAAGEIASALGLPVPAGALEEARAYEGADSAELLHALRADATRLFVGAPEPLASPYEGVWRAADDGVDALLFVNPHSMDVERFVRACGLGRADGAPNDPLDHASTECALLEYFAGVEAGIVALPEGRTAQDLPGGSAAAAYAEFLEGHARVWMPRFAEAATACAREPFFRAAAAFLAVLVRA